jgi:hypothetical protein
VSTRHWNDDWPTFPLGSLAWTTKVLVPAGAVNEVPDGEQGVTAAPLSVHVYARAEDALSGSLAVQANVAEVELVSAGGVWVKLTDGAVLSTV